MKVSRAGVEDAALPQKTLSKHPETEWSLSLINPLLLVADKHKFLQACTVTFRKEWKSV